MKTALNGGGGGGVQCRGQHWTVTAAGASDRQ